MQITSLKLTRADKIKVANTEDIFEILSKILKRESKINQDKKHLWFIGISKRDYILCVDTVSLGDFSMSSVDPMSVFRNGIWKGAKYAILAHNNPDGNIEASKEDLKITDRLCQCGIILDLALEPEIFPRGCNIFCNRFIGVSYLREECPKGLPAVAICYSSNIW